MLLHPLVFSLALSVTSVSAATKQRWLSTWATMPQLCEPSNLPPAPFTQSNSVFADATLRQSFKISRTGSSIRLRVSNAFGPVALNISKVTVALPANASAVGTPTINTATLRNVTFSGNPSFSVPNAAQIVSDPIQIPVAENGALTVSMFLAQGQSGNSITAHPGSRTTSFFVNGDQTSSANITGSSVQTAEHWYFISGVEVVSPDTNTRALAIVGDSLTDGRGSTENQNDRWPDQLYDRIRKNNSLPLTYLNQAAGGNRVLLDGLGPAALSRIDRDVLSQTQVTSVILFEGVNDIGTADATTAGQAAVVRDLIAGFQQIITRVQAQDKKIFGATITPFGGNDPYDDAAGLREASRQTVNKWIRTSGAFDAVFDFDAAVRDPSNPRRLDPAIDVGDHLHMTPAGYARIAAAVPLGVL